MRTNSIARRPDLTLEDTRERKPIFLLNMACPYEMNKEEEKVERMHIQSTLHNSDRFYPDFCIFRTELLSPISFLLKFKTEKVST